MADDNRPLRYEDCLIDGKFYITTMESARLKNVFEFRALEIERDKLKLEIDRAWIQRYRDYFLTDEQPGDRAFLIDYRELPPMKVTANLPIIDEKGR